MFINADDGGNPAGAEIQYMTPTEGPNLFFDVTPGTSASWNRNLTTVRTEAGKDTLLYFTGPDADKELWVITSLDKKAAPVGDMGPGSTEPFDLEGLNSALYFSTGKYKSLFKYEYVPVFNISSNLISTLNESKSDTATFRLKFINPEGISDDAPYVNFSIAGDWKISLGGDDPFTSTKRLYKSAFQPDMDTIIKVLIGSIDKEAWDQTLTLTCSILTTDAEVNTIKVTAAWETEPAFKNTELFYVRFGDYSPLTVDPTYENFGSMQSNTDQLYGTDLLPDGQEVKWGRTGSFETQTWWEADRFTNFIGLNHPKENNHLTYSFPLESGKYHLLVVMTSRQWTQSRPSVFTYPGYSEAIDINNQRIIKDVIIDYVKGSDTAFNVNWAQSNPDVGLVVGGFLKIGKADEFVSVKTNKTSDDGYSVYPNPSKGNVHIRSNGAIRNANFEVLDMTGKTVQSGSVRGMDNLINTSNLAKGMYFIKIRTNTTVESHKLIIQK